MSPAKEHAEWLNLVPNTGPFLSMPVLLRTFPQGLDGRDPEHAARLREAYEDWLDRGETQPAVHHAWIVHVLRELLEYPSALLVEGQAIPAGLEASQPLFGETLRPDFVLKHRDAGGPVQLLINVYPHAQDLEKPFSGAPWKAAPGTRMMELLHATDLPVGLVTNGEEWMLVYAPRGETTGFASWYADLWMQEPLTLRAFHSLLHLRRFLGVAADETLSALLTASSKDQQEVTEQLGFQVRKAVEVLVQAFDKLDAESERELLGGVDAKELYNSALTVMMRLVFLFSAEEKGMLLLGDRLYDSHYAVSSLRELLRDRADQHGEEILERRHDAWCRLLATFRAVHSGVQHEAMRLPAYGGTLFNPERYPFLEGRAPGSSWDAAQPLKINNRVVLHLLEALQLLRMKVPGGGPTEARRLSFKALDIEQIGHVYEGLLDHTAKRAREVVLGLTGANRQDCEVPLAKLEELFKAKGTEALVEFLQDQTGRSAATLKKAVENSDLLDTHKLLLACGQDPRLEARVRPFAGLLRDDSFGQPLVVREGSVYVTSGSDRRSTGTHYTPRSLTEPIVKHTLEPLVYVGPAEGKPEKEWQLKTPKELLDLKVCDMACGSGAFLVQACRYLSERLVEAWEKCERANPGQVLVTPEGGFSAGGTSERLVPKDAAERMVIARRYVADRCLYGVDINPMAVEMAKLSLWLITMQRNLPFTFLDHALKCGDSLLGFHSLEQLESLHISPKHADSIPNFWQDHAKSLFEKAVLLRQELETLPTLTPADSQRKADLHAQAEDALDLVRTLCDLIVGAAISTADGNAAKRDGAPSAAFEEERENILVRIAGLDLMNDATIKESISRLKKHAREKLRSFRPFQWPVEFPEIFRSRESAGFDALFGNPPFMGCKYFKPVLGDGYFQFLSSTMNESPGRADLCAFFFHKAEELLSQSGCAGLVATNTISQGDTQIVALHHLSVPNPRIFNATIEMRWPGTAAVYVNVLHWSKSYYTAMRSYLNDKPVPMISEYLTGTLITRPFTLKANLNICFQGSIPNAAGLLLTPHEAFELLNSSPFEKEVVKPYLDDINFSSDFKAKRYCIFFGNMTELEAARFPTSFRRCEDLVRAVKLKKGGASAKYWWRFYRYSPELYTNIFNLKRVLVTSFLTKHLCFSFVPSAQVFSNRLAVVADGDSIRFAILQSAFHEAWARQFSTTLKLDLTYTPRDCFETFPLPELKPRLRDVGEKLHNHRSQTMLARQLGLTDLYNLFHNRADSSPDIQKLRALHVEMDEAVAQAYGWGDLKLGHGFHPTKQGERFTLSPQARQEVLDRLLKLNHERYAEEVKQGLHDKKGKGGGGKRGAKKSVDDGPLFD
jgi:hypothetical protein